MLEVLTTLNTYLIDGITLVLAVLACALTAKLLAPISERLKLVVRTRRSAI